MGAMVFEVETAYANRRMKKIKDSAARKPFSRKCAVEEDEASSEMTSEPIRKHTPNQSSRAKELDAMLHCAQKNRSVDLLHNMVNEKLECDVPALRSCDSMSFSSDYSLSTRSSFETLSLSPIKKMRSSLSRHNAEWSILEWIAT